MVSRQSVALRFVLILIIHNKHVIQLTKQTNAQTEPERTIHWNDTKYSKIMLDIAKLDWFTNPRINNYKFFMPWSTNLTDKLRVKNLRWRKITSNHGALWRFPLDQNFRKFRFRIKQLRIFQNVRFQNFGAETCRGCPFSRKCRNRGLDHFAFHFTGCSAPVSPAATVEWKDGGVNGGPLLVLRELFYYRRFVRFFTTPMCWRKRRNCTTRCSRQ